TAYQNLTQVAAPKVPSPLISVLLPTYNTPIRWLNRCIASVVHQTYRNWELCVADDASPDPAVATALERWAEADSRIQVRRRSINGHISEATNSALEMARGEFFALLDHDDELPLDALQWVAR